MRNKLVAPLALVGASLVSVTTLTLYAGHGDSRVQPVIGRFEGEVDDVLTSIIVRVMPAIRLSSRILPCW